MPNQVLITGGAGFIGSHLANTLLNEGYKIRILDNLDPQVHPDRLAKNVPRDAEFILGDVTDRETLRQALDGVDAVFHFAALTGVGQSMYQVSRYTHTNIFGTAQFLDIVASERSSLRKIIVASSRAVYGEGKNQCARCGVVYPPSRNVDQLKDRIWDVSCTYCGKPVSWLPTDEDSPAKPGSIYALTKFTQEELCRNVGRAFGVPITVLRFFNVYGPGQAPANPYTGVLTSFIVKCLKGEAIEVYEDGRETRDFVHVQDVVRACLLALTNDSADWETFNVGTGIALSILELANLVSEQILCDAPSNVQILPIARVGDIRHCVADIRKVQRVLGFRADNQIASSLPELIKWVASQTHIDMSAQARRELVARGLLVGAGNEDPPSLEKGQK